MSTSKMPKRAQRPGFLCPVAVVVVLVLLHYWSWSPTMTVQTMTRSVVGIKGVLVCLLAVLPVVQSEIRAFNLLLEPMSEYIHFVDGFLQAPGLIDLSNLRFIAVGEAYAGGDDDEDDDDEDDIVFQEDEDEDGGNRRRLDGETENAGDGDSDVSLSGTALDIAVFHLPDECANTRVGCDWPDLGIGARTEDGVIRYCCSNDAIDLGLCQGNQYGRLIMDATKFSGKHRFKNVPATGEFDEQLKYGRFEQKSDSGKYVLAMANCNDEGRPVKVKGHTVWKSVHGYLPADLFGLMYFFAGLTIVYFLMLAWYGITMRLHEESTIPIQRWILGTICLGTLELFFRTGDLFVWNEDGSRFWFAFYVGVILGVLKRGISRCLIVMVSLGWGVVRDDLGGVMKKINFLGGLYIVVSAVRDIMTVLAFTEVQKMSQEEEDELFDIVTILTMVIAFIDVLFYLWIIDALNGTMEYLENMSQTSKLLQFLRLRCLLLFSILFAVIWAVFGIVDSYDAGIVDQEQEWVIDASMELNYIFVLAGVAYLWRPHANAKDYAYVMELPAMNAGADEDGDGGLELTGVVPSAADDDDDDEEVRVHELSKGGGFRDEPSSE